MKHLWVQSLPSGNPYAPNNLAGANPPLGKLTPTSIASTLLQLVMSHPCNRLTESGSFANINA